jgi:hypothetical protein
MFDTWFRGLLGRKREQKAPAPRNYRPEVEVLEDRTVPAAIRDLVGFRANIFLPNIFPPFAGFNNLSIIQGGFTEDGSQGPVGLGFNINFFGVHTNAAFLNTNGNISLGAPTATTPGLSNLPMSGIPLIAPFFADVDTFFFIGSEPVTYGYANIGGHNVFGVDWINVSYIPISGSTTFRVNSFQLILIDRSETGPGNFDIEFNYNSIQWEVGDTDAGFVPANGLGPRSAVAGFSDGTGITGHYFLLDGSGHPGAFLDGGPNALNAHSLFASTPGRYHFFFRNGVPVFGLPGVGADLTPFLQELNPVRFVRHPNSVYSGRFFVQRKGGSVAAFLDDPVLDEVGAIPINSSGPPLTLIFVKLPKGVTLANPTGITAGGFPFITLPASSLSFKGDRLRVVLNFLNPLHRPLGSFYLGFRYVVFAGPFNPAQI